MTSLGPRRHREFVAHLTHELRAPVCVIRAALDILKRHFSRKLPQEDRRLLSTATRNTDRLSSLIDDILDFARLEAGRLKVAAKAIRPEALAREAADIMRPWADKKKIELAADLPPGLPAVAADPKRVVQVFANLLSNAIKFTPEGGRVRVEARPEAGTHETQGPTPSVVFAVRDTGPGIAEEDRERIFEKYVQVAAGGNHPGGTGLGLTISRALVELMGGRIWVESEQGKGASFLFTLPVSNGAVHPNGHKSVNLLDLLRVPAHGASAQPTAAERRRSPRVLLSDSCSLRPARGGSVGRSSRLQDVGFFGARLETDSPLSRGDACNVDLSIGDRRFGSLHAEVVWSTQSTGGWQCGLSFDPAMAAPIRGALVQLLQQTPLQ